MAVQDAHARYARIVKALLKEEGVSVGAETKGFGSSALKVYGRIFAMVDAKGSFVVKLPREEGTTRERAHSAAPSFTAHVRRSTPEDATPGDRLLNPRRSSRDGYRG